MRKIDILSKIIDKEINSEIYYDYYYHDYDYDWYQDDYEYTKEIIYYECHTLPITNFNIYSTRHGIRSFSYYNLGGYIKMDSFYSKQKKRSIKLDKILGLVSYKPTIGELIKNGRNL